MYIGCYEVAGNPKPGAEAIRVGLLLRDVDPWGGCHIVREDWNLEDNHIDFCISYETTTEAERTIMLALKSLPENQRYAAMAVADEYVIA